MNLNQIKAARQVIFSTVRNYIDITQLSNPIKGYGVDMFAMGELIVREQRLHKISEPDLRLMIKIDGRPFWGRTYFCFVHEHIKKHYICMSPSVNFLHYLHLLQLFRCYVGFRFTEDTELKCVSDHVICIL